MGWSADQMWDDSFNSQFLYEPEDDGWCEEHGEHIPIGCDCP